MTQITCDICNKDKPAITKYKSGVRGKYWEYYCADCDLEYGCENELLGYEQAALTHWKVISKAKNNGSFYENAGPYIKENKIPFISDPIDVEFVVEGSDIKQAEEQAQAYMLYKYGHEAYSIDTDITEIQ